MRGGGLMIAGAGWLGTLLGWLALAHAGAPPYPEHHLPELALVAVAGPLATCLGWVAARRHELPLALGAGLAIYLGAPFLAATVTALILPGSQVDAGGSPVYFHTLLAVHMLAAAAMAVWRGWFSRRTA